MYKIKSKGTVRNEDSPMKEEENNESFELEIKKEVVKRLKPSSDDDLDSRYPDSDKGI